MSSSPFTSTGPLTTEEFHKILRDTAYGLKNSRDRTLKLEENLARERELTAELEMTFISRTLIYIEHIVSTIIWSDGRLGLMISP
jgi:hypothetical protein